ncbi:MAG: SPOR domain-containing protein [Thalassobaculaceae bacterium]
MSQDGDGLQADAIDRPGPPPELRDPPRRSRALGAFLATFALAAFAGVVWYAYDRGLQAGSEATAPLIQSDPSPIKVRPEQPGGLDVPNQDKMVYGALRPDQNGGETVERLLPPPETPVEPPQPAPPPISQEPVAQEPASQPSAETEDRGAPAADGTATVPIPARTPQPVPGAGPATAPEADPAPTTDRAEATAPPPPPPPAPQAQENDIPPARAPEPARSPEPEPQVAAAPPPAPEPQPIPQPTPQPAPRPEPAVQPEPAAQPSAQSSPQPAATPPSGRFRVQLGAFRDEAAARREWDRLSRRYPDVLSGLTLRIQQVDLGAGKGVFHRIQGGMLSEAAAEQACATLKSRNQACLLVRP